VPIYIARFSITLKVPIETNESTLPELRLRGDGSPVAETVIRAKIDNGFIREFQLKVVYSGGDLATFTVAGRRVEDLVGLA
jgi:hypothetical protein